MAPYSTLKIQQKWEDMICYAYVVLRQFPRSEKQTLGSRLQDNLWAGLETIIEANASRSKLQLLYHLDRKIKVILGTIRVAYDMRIIAPKKYQHLSKLLVEIGRMLGGWIKFSKS